MPPSFLRVLMVAAALSACSAPSADQGDRGHDATGGAAGSSSAAGATTSGVGASSGTGGVGGGGTDAAGRSGSDSGGTAPTGPSGEIVVSSLVYYPIAAQSQTFAYARFRAGPAVTSSPTTQYGDCSVSEACADEPVPVAPHAGLITVLSPGPSFALELPPNAVGVYPQWSQSGSVFTGAESLSISAAGGDVPAFSRELTYPLLLLVTEPVLAAGESVARAPRTGDLTLRWDRGTAGVLLQVQSQKAMNALVCTVPSELGTLTIPAAALGRLDVGSELLLLTAVAEHVQAGDFDVSLLLAGVAVTPDKMRRVSIELD
jgi:hypothetical protein